MVFCPTWSARENGQSLSLSLFFQSASDGVGPLAYPRTDASENIQCRRLSRPVVRDVANSSVPSHVPPTFDLDNAEEFHIPPTIPLSSMSPRIFFPLLDESRMNWFL